MQFTALLSLFEDNAPAVIIGLFIASCCIEVIPVKVNPWTWFSRHILNAGMFDKLNAIETNVLSTDEKVEKLKYDMERESAVSARARILSFSDELLRDVQHSKESFDSVLSDIDCYERYCDGHPEFSNNKTKISVAEIKESYRERLEKHDFLC